MNIIKKLMNIQNELKAPKNQFNKFGDYKYRNCEDILEAVKPLLFKNGLILNISDEIVAIGDRFYVQAIAKVIDEENNFIESKAYAREPSEKPKMDNSQVTGSASSYARKYALNGLFCIDDSKDADFYDNTKNNNDNTKKENKVYNKNSNDKNNNDNTKNDKITGKEEAQIQYYINLHKIELQTILDTYGVKELSQLSIVEANQIINKFKSKESKEQ